MLINVKFLGCGKEMKNVLKLRISYDTEEELKKAINILNPVVKIRLRVFIIRHSLHSNILLISPVSGCRVPGWAYIN